VNFSFLLWSHIKVCVNVDDSNFFPLGVLKNIF
jgi:hypothetical protein